MFPMLSSLIIVLDSPMSPDSINISGDERSGDFESAQSTRLKFNSVLYSFLTLNVFSFIAAWN